MLKIPHHNKPALQAIQLWQAQPVALQVQVARSIWQKMRGLAWRRQMPGDGLLFEFKKPCRPAFWMLGMRFALDIVWIAADGRVVGWSENLKPPRRMWWSTIFPWRLPRFQPQQNIAYALEIRAGKRQEWRIDEKTSLQMVPGTTGPNLG